MGASPNVTPWTTAALGASVAFAVQGPSLAAGGLATLAVAIGVAALFAAPLAHLVPASSTDRPALAAALTGWTDTLRAVTVAAMIAPTVAALGMKGTLLALVAWAWPAVAPRGGPLVWALPLLAAGGLALGAASVATGSVVSLSETPGWYGVEPWWTAAMIGLAAAGLGAHAHGGAGPRWFGIGAGGLVAVGLALQSAARYAETAQVADDGWALTLAAGLAGLAPLGAVRATATAPMLSPHRLGFSALGLAVTLALAGPAAAALDTFWTAILPLASAIHLAMTAALHPARSPARWGSMAGAAALGVMAAFFAADPPDTAAAVALASLGVAAVWIAGSKALLARPA